VCGYCVEVSRVQKHRMGKGGEEENIRGRREEEEVGEGQTQVGKEVRQPTPH